jgi:[CysO sulfur-carrier protein]-S-L-cysteine hydrolase
MTVPSAIIFSKNQIGILVRHSKENSPNESCAILLGSVHNTQVIVKEIFPAKNIELSPVSFTISPEELIMAYKDAEEKKLAVSGIFHSHPDSIAYPSSTDKKYMKLNSYPWVIFSNIDNEFKAYIYDSDIVPVPVKVL